MSLSERFDRDTAQKTRETLEYILVYAVCFAVQLVKIGATRGMAFASKHRSSELHSVVEEARIKAANCATSSFMGL